MVNEKCRTTRPASFEIEIEIEVEIDIIAGRITGEITALTLFGGLKEESAVMIDQVRAIDRKRLIKKVGELPSGIAASVKDNLKTVMDL